MSQIHFFSEETEFELDHETKIRSWIRTVLHSEKKTLDHLNIIFCSDEYLLDLNQRYLNRDYLTDVITFDQSETDSIAGDIFVSIERVKENANTFGAAFHDELLRVVIHGVLHLAGYNDHSHKEKELMKKKEEASLSLLAQR